MTSWDVAWWREHLVWALTECVRLEVRCGQPNCAAASRGHVSGTCLVCVSNQVPTVTVIYAYCRFHTGSLGVHRDLREA